MKSLHRGTSTKSEFMTISHVFRSRMSFDFTRMQLHSHASHVLRVHSLCPEPSRSIFHVSQHHTAKIRAESEEPINYSHHTVKQIEQRSVSEREDRRLHGSEDCDSVSVPSGITESANIASVREEIPAFNCIPAVLALCKCCAGGRSHRPLISRACCE